MRSDRLLCQHKLEKNLQGQNHGDVLIRFPVTIKERDGFPNSYLKAEHPP